MADGPHNYKLLGTGPHQDLQAVLSLKYTFICQVHVPWTTWTLVPWEQAMVLEKSKPTYPVALTIHVSLQQGKRQFKTRLLQQTALEVLRMHSHNRWEYQQYCKDSRPRKIWEQLPLTLWRWWEKILSSVSLSLSTNLVLVPQSLFWFTPPFQSLRDTQQCPSLPLRRSRRSRSQTSGLRRSVPHTPRTRGSPSGLLAEDRLSGRRRSGPCRGPDPQGGPFLWPSSSFRETKTNPTRCISGLPVRTAETARGGAKGGQCRHISYIWIYIYIYGSPMECMGTNTGDQKARRSSLAGL